jgi:8-oxo-dGTP pyrophosphatase MutT (NUDIX family)
VPAVIHRVTQLDLKCDPWTWPFAIERRADIDAHFALKQAEKPKLWNGRVLLGRNPVFSEGCFSADYFEADFASFLAWRDWGFADSSVFNGFGMGALRGNDGAFVLGEMAQHTANAGRVYFPSGTPDLDDLRGGIVDIAGSVAREVEEETGLTAADYRADEHWDCVVSGAAIAIIRILDVAMTGEALRRKILANLAKQQSPELSAIHLVRDVGDLTPAMPRFVTAFIEAQAPRGGADNGSGAATP